MLTLKQPYTLYFVHQSERRSRQPRLSPFCYMLVGQGTEPKNTSSVEEAQGYANATREQALIIAVRMVENLK